MTLLTVLYIRTASSAFGCPASSAAAPRALDAQAQQARALRELQRRHPEAGGGDGRRGDSAAGSFVEGTIRRRSRASLRPARSRPSPDAPAGLFLWSGLCQPQDDVAVALAGHESAPSRLTNSVARQIRTPPRPSGSGGKPIIPNRGLGPLQGSASPPRTDAKGDYFSTFSASPSISLPSASARALASRSTIDRETRSAKLKVDSPFTSLLSRQTSSVS